MFFLIIKRYNIAFIAICGNLIKNAHQEIKLVQTRRVFFRALPNKTVTFEKEKDRNFALCKYEYRIIMLKALKNLSPNKLF